MALGGGLFIHSGDVFFHLGPECQIVPGEHLGLFGYFVSKPARQAL